MPSVGYATLQIIPSVRGIGDEIRRQLVPPSEQGGRQAGQAAGGGFATALKAGVAGAAVAAGAVLVAGLTKAIEQANVASTLQAQLGTTRKVADAQGKLAGKLYGAGVAGSFQGAADSIKAVVQAGLAPPDATNRQLQSIATKASDVATVFGQDLGGVTNAVSQLMRTGLAKNAGQAFDLLTKGFQSGADKAGDLLDTINEYGTQFRKAGLDGSTAIGLLNQAIRAGARDSDVAADAIKEFSIRAVDGSKTTATGFKMLGLDADNMAARFSKGGKSANAVLDLTLDRLRGIKDPVQQSQAAVALFGTQAEDLGAALLAMDPSKAATGLGRIGGAAGKLGKTIRSGPSHEIEVFKRAIEQTFVTTLGGKVLPVITRAGGWINTNLLPPARAAASALSSALGPAIRAVGTAISGTVGWLRDLGTWLIPAGIAVGGLTLAMTAQRIATAATAGVFRAYRVAILAWTAVQRGATIAQVAFNAVMNANPVILVITAIVALGAAFVVAYQKVGWFRAAVDAAWSGIKTATSFLWNSILKPAFNGIVTALKAVGSAFSWLWSTILSPVINFIVTAFKILFTAIVVVALLPIMGVAKALGALFSWLWQAAIAPAIRAIGAVFSWLYNTIIRPVFGAVVAYIQAWWLGVKTVFTAVVGFLRATLGAAFRWLYSNVVQPVWTAIRAAIAAAWAGVKVILAAFRTYIQGPLANVFRWLRDNVIRPAWNGIKSAISTVWSRGIKPVFDAVKTAVGKVGDAFKTAVSAIKRAWDKVSSIAKKPIGFIINTVYNGGIVGVWNKVASAFGAPKLSTFHPKGFARGGVLAGHQTAKRDDQLVPMRSGEGVLVPEVVRGLGPGTIHALNAAGNTGGVGAVRRLTGQGYATGGIIGQGWSWLKSASTTAWDKVKQGASWLKDTIKGSALAGLNKVVKPLIERVSGSASLYKSMITRVPKTMLSSIVGWSGKADQKYEALGIGGKGYAAALRWARTQAGKRYQWGGNGNPSWDCSGFMSAIESVIRGERPHRRWATGAFPPGTSGWKRNARSPFMIGITNAGVGHTAGTLNGVNVESRGGDGVLVGSRARSYRSSLFTSRWGFVGKYDAGGWLQPGVSTVVNATGQPEAVLTGPQWRVAEAAMARTAGLQPGDELQLVVDGQEFHGYVDARAGAQARRENGRVLTALNARPRR